MTETLEHELQEEVSTEIKEKKLEQSNYQSYHSPSIEMSINTQNTQDTRNTKSELDYNLIDVLAKKSENIEYNVTSSIASLGPGNLLREAREAANLKREDVAKELRLAKRHVEYLEQDAYHKFSAVAFYVGYVRNYSKLLGLDDNKMIAKFYAVYKVKPDIIANNINTQEIEHRQAWYSYLAKSNESFSKTKLVIIASVTTTVLLLILWYFTSQYGKNDNNNNNIVAAKKIESLEPDKVDTLLPTSPVIVQKKNMLDNVS